MPGWTKTGRLQHWRKLAERFRETNPELAAQYLHWVECEEANPE
jgi:hypothetical protein